MAGVFRISLFSILWIFGNTDLMGQSTAYKLLLTSLYDRGFDTISPNGLKNSSVIFLDTREIEEYETSHIKGAVWVGFDDFQINRLAGIDKKSELVVYCTVGARSEKIGKILKEAGFTKVKNLYGGIIHWKNEGYELFDEKGATENVHTYSPAWGIWLRSGVRVDGSP